MGKLSVTVSGKTCQAWSSQTPQKPQPSIKDKDFPDNTMVLANNYCRNPDSTTGGPWCYTMDPATRWELCNISFCCKFLLHKSTRMKV